MTMLSQYATFTVLMIVSLTVGATEIQIPDSCNSVYKFYCHLSDECFPSNIKCDGTPQCEQGEDETDCIPCTKETAESQKNFYCSATNSCISVDWKCDGFDDCPDGEDEQNCDSTGAESCNEDQWFCGDGQCITADWKCDTQRDCKNGADEEDCEVSCAADQISCVPTGGTSKQCISAQWRCDGENDCKDGEDEVNCDAVTCPKDRFNCSAEDTCMPNSWKCDGDADCLSGEDEAVETCAGTTVPTKNTGLCTALEFKCKTGSTQCIIGVWRCDGQPDCDDGSDEEDGCDQEKTCSDAEFKCVDNDQCIPRFLTCNGKSECADGSDEQLDSCKKKNDTVCDLTKGEFKCDKGEYHSPCVSFDKLCDDNEDCFGGLDESPEYCGENAVTDYCDSTTRCGGNPRVSCTNIYTELESNHNRTVGYICHCPSGYKHIANDCIDVDECTDTKNQACDQICTNEPGKYRCACNEGYYLAQDGKSCIVHNDVHPKLLFSNRHAIRSIHIHGQGEYMPLLDSKDAVALDFDYARKEVFYSDVTEKKLYKFKLPTEDMEDDLQQEELHIRGIQEPDRLAYDWIYKHLYWTDTSSNTINMACVDDQTDEDGYKHSLVLYQNEDPTCVNASAEEIGSDVCIDEPRALAVHPRKGWAFWSDWGNKPHIVLAALDGSSKQMIAYNKKDSHQYLHWPNGLTLDLAGETERLYWIDAKLHSLFMCTINRCIQTINLLAYDADKIKHPFSITVFENKVYWTEWTMKQIVSADKYTGQDITQILDDLEQPMDLKVYHPMSQQNSTNHCAVEEGQEPLCGQLCMPKPWTRVEDTQDYMPVPVGQAKYRCKCSDGYQMNLDGRTCARDQPPSPPTISHKPFVAVTKAQTGTVDTGLSVGIIGAIAGTVVLLVAVLICVTLFIVMRRIKQKKSKNMNFDNPIYKRTTEDKLELPRHEYQPSQTDPTATVPLTSSEATSSSQEFDV